jgi:predicted nucleic acid-binding protein
MASPPAPVGFLRTAAPPAGRCQGQGPESQQDDDRNGRPTPSPSCGASLTVATRWLQGRGRPRIVVTYGELRAGVLAASDVSVRSRRLTTLQTVVDLHPVPIDTAVADEWARLRLLLAEAGRRADLDDTWIAATALALDVPVVSQDADYATLAESSDLRAIAV